MQKLLLEILAGWTRAGLALLTAYLVQHNVLTPDQGARLSDELFARALEWAPLVIAMVWTAAAKYRSRVKFLTALDAPAGTTEAQVNLRIDNGMGASVKAVPAVLLAIALAAGAAGTPACSTHVPPKGTYSPVGEKAYRADALIKDLTAISQTAINLNEMQSKLHLHDRDTAYVRDFALVAGAALNAYGQGATTLESARQAVAMMPLPPGIPVAARAAFDKAVADHGAGASVLVLVVDAYKAFRSSLSPDALANPRLLALLNAIDSGVQSIPLQ